MTNSQRWKTLACFILIHAAALSGKAAEVHLKQRADSQGSVVLLGDIADLKEDQANPILAGGDGPTDVAALARIELFPAPGVARWRTVGRGELRELLGLHGVDLTRVRFTGAEAVIVQTRQQPKLRNATLATMTSGVSALRPAFDATLVQAQPRADASRPADSPAVEMVVSAVHDLRRGEIIRESDVAMIPVPVTGRGSANSLGIQPAVRTEEVIGMAATRPIVANRPLDLRSLARPLAVRRGDLVTVTSLAPGVRVETVARAVDDAALDELVLLESLVNRKKYTARVTGDKTAEVYAGGMRVSSPPRRGPDARQHSSTLRRAAP